MVAEIKKEVRELNGVNIETKDHVKAARSFIEALESNEEDTINKSAYNLARLAEIGIDITNAVPILTGFLDQKHITLPGNAAEALMWHFMNTKNEAEIARLLNHKNKLVREAAADIIAFAPEKHDASFMVGVLASAIESEDPKIQKSALYALQLEAGKGTDIAIAVEELKKLITPQKGILAKLFALNLFETQAKRQSEAQIETAKIAVHCLVRHYLNAENLAELTKLSQTSEEVKKLVVKSIILSAFIGLPCTQVKPLLKEVLKSNSQEIRSYAENALQVIN